MGLNLSKNYDSIENFGKIGFWNVFKAKKINSEENVCLWQLDEEYIKNQFKNKGNPDIYIKNCKNGIIQLRKLIHPHILKILEFNENISPLSFCSEPFNNFLINFKNLNKDEIYYILLQIVDIFNFLHNTVNLIHLNISLNSFLINNDFNLKIWDFTFFTFNINNDNLINPRIGSWSESPFQPLINFSSPELVLKNEICFKSDVFSFGLLISSLFLNRFIITISTRKEYLLIIKNIYQQLPNFLDNDLKDLLEKCLNFSIDLRPNFNFIKEHNFFNNNIIIKVFNYIDHIFLKSLKDKLIFFKGFFKIIDLFSDKILINKFLPIFKIELNNQILFGPVLLPLIIQIGNKIDLNLFEKDILLFILPYFNIIDPIEMILSIFSCFNILINKINSKKHFEILYPIFITSFKSNSLKLKIESIKNLSFLINSLPNNIIENELFENLINFLKISNDINSFNYSIESLILILNFLNLNKIEIIFQIIFNKFSFLILNDCSKILYKLILKLKLNNNYSLRFIIPLSSFLLSLENTPLKISNKLFNIINNLLIEFSNINKIKENYLEEEENLINENYLEEEENTINKIINNNLKNKKKLKFK